MIELRRPLTRRALLTSAVVVLSASDETVAAARKPKTRSTAPAEPIFPGTPLPIPRLVDLVDGATFDLVAETTRHAFVAGKPVDTLGYGGTHLGPTLRVTRGTRPKVRLINRLARPTNVHWHGLLVPSSQDAATHPGLRTGESWETRLDVDQPAATLWYHAHIHGRTARDVHDGLAGMMIVEDAESAGLGLPSTWGVDDIPLVLQDRVFDEAGRPVFEMTPARVEHGFRGPDMIVNGVTEAVAKVPARLVRLRLLNAANARNFRLFFEDNRNFRLIATDGGFLREPAELSLLVLTPGERAEILVDFAEGHGVLLTGPDGHEHRSGAHGAILPDVIDRPARLVAFEAARDELPTAKVPARLAGSTALDRPPAGVRRRRFELRVLPNPAASGGGLDPHAMHRSMTRGSVDRATETDSAPPLLLTINGRSFAMERIDEKVDLGASEIWEIVSPDMAHPFHVHGVHFAVLSEDGGTPKAWNRGPKDTVLVENGAELLVTFAHPADAARPFLYHCHLLEHEDGGMMGTFTVG
ncbi:MAG: multicopper oxidase domain-containing protein [Siculibacillus sp.]|nr:multicopper oxidase domain-containing protein [Siculibacillus sp.]